MQWLTRSGLLEVYTNIQKFPKFPSFDLCITQGLIENVGYAARITQEPKIALDSSSKKRKVLCFETPDDQ